MISLIAAIGKDHELGKDNQLIFHIKADMQFFRSTTLGHAVLMGRKTFESIGRPLPGRTNYVVTTNPSSLPDGVEPVTDLDRFLKLWQTSSDELFVIGGASIYAAALPLATHLYLTEINASAPADTFFPTFDHALYSREVIKKGKENDLTYSFVKYTSI